LQVRMAEWMVFVPTGLSFMQALIVFVGVLLVALVVNGSVIIGRTICSTR
jgi:hypothetical protein